MTDETINVIAGVDTHADTHHVAVITEHGQPVADQQFPATGIGYRQIAHFITDFVTGYGAVIGIGIEGTGSYGAALARSLAEDGLTIHEVNRPNRQARRLKGKSDPLDAYQAAEAVLAGRSIATPKSRDGAVESLRNLRTERESAMRARVAAINQIKNLLITASESLRAKYRPTTNADLISKLAQTRPSGGLTDPATTTAKTLKRLAIRYRQLDEEINTIDDELDQIIAVHAPMLRDLQGVGTDAASQLLVTVGDNPERVTNQAKFAALTGVSPIPASSGKTSRHRLNRGGDRAANKAIHHVVLVRMSSDRRTKAYVARRREEGKSTKEIIRCLKRYVAREIYAQIFHPTPAPNGDLLRTLRKEQGISLHTAANALDVNMNTLSRLERGLNRHDDLYHRYETWLTTGNEKPNHTAA